MSTWMRCHDARGATNWRTHRGKVCGGAGGMRRTSCGRWWCEEGNQKQRNHQYEKGWDFTITLTRTTLIHAPAESSRLALRHERLCRCRVGASFSAHHVPQVYLCQGSQPILALSLYRAQIEGLTGTAKECLPARGTHEPSRAGPRASNLLGQGKKASQ